MTTTFKKRQKEMKRQDKARSKAEKRAQKKLETPGGDVIGNDGIAWEDGIGTPEELAARARLDLAEFDKELAAETQE